MVGVTGSIPVAPTIDPDPLLSFAGRPISGRRGIWQMPTMFRTICTIAITFLAAMSGVVLAETSATGPVTFFEFTFPEEIAGAQRVSIRDYESGTPGLGYSAGYRQPNLTGTVYIYDAGKRSIPDDPQAPLVKAELEQSQREIFGLQERGAYSKVERKGSFTIEDAHGRTRFICTAFAYVANDGRPVDSFACLGVAKSKFLKFRISIGRHDGSQVEAKGFVGAWIDRLWPPS